MRYSWRMGFLCAHRSWAGVLCAVLLLFSMSVDAARKTAASAPAPLLPPPFRDAIEHGVANGAYRSLAVGLIDGKQHGTFYFGHRDGADSKPADDDSQFDKDDLDAVGIPKFDFLGLGALSLVRRSFDMIEVRTGTRPPVPAGLTAGFTPPAWPEP